ncbi:LysR substrate-binding domain-containing protein [Salinivibrio kushneri]|uniref:LysR substrate-binding domain-containing protein n=1 Tax=Salinivibrio kushneri TaxID=1908198 RepID=A0AA47LSB4_9GAMM|nr:LysR substrate-binding domain-containing protein [Salinivibrio kushneri]WBA09720.1 LysR substrate-binding domain-containing protein [Salinivibrio kushneri]
MMHESSTVRELDLVVLKTFVTVVEKGSFTRAGESLYLAQSTVSAHMKRLEALFEKPLLQRGQTAVLPTPAGERLLAHARQLLRQNALAWQEMTDQRLDGVVRLGIPDDYLIYLPEALSMFEARYPGVELEVSCGLSVELVQEVKAGALDIAITTRQPNSPGGEVLRAEPMTWVTGVGHDTHQRQPLPLALSKQGVCIFRERALAALTSAGITHRIAYSSASLSGLSSAVRAGLAITVLTPSMMGEGLRALGEEEGLPKLPNTEITLHQRHGDLSGAAIALIQQLRDSVIFKPHQDVLVNK